MSKVANVIQETMQKGRAIVSDRKIGKEGYVRLGEIYEEGFDRIGEVVTQSGEMPELSASWVRASREIAKLREESPSDAKAVLRRYELFFKEAAQQLTGGMIGGSIGQVLQKTSAPIPVEVNQAAGETSRNILEEMNVRWTDKGDDRIVTVTRPAKSFSTIYQEINEMPDRKQDGIWKDIPLMEGPKEDNVPGDPTEVTFVIHFGSGGKTREEHEAFLASQGADGEKFADPFLVAAAEGWLRVKTGESLFKFKGVNYGIRTARSKTKKGAPVWGLFSDSGGVNVYPYYSGVDGRFVAVVACGSPNQKT